jgi:hypothetical protein
VVFMSFVGKTLGSAIGLRLTVFQPYQPRYDERLKIFCPSPTNLDQTPRTGCARSHP